MIGKIVCKLDTRPHCYNGWSGTKRSPACNYTGGHYCDRRKGHDGRCRCVCGATAKHREGCCDAAKGVGGG